MLLSQLVIAMCQYFCICVALVLIYVVENLSSNGKTFDRRCRVEATNTRYFLGNDIICLIVQYYFVVYDGWMDAVTEREGARN